jgi:hypothetical protein
MFDAILGEWRGTKRLYLEGAEGPELASPSALRAALTVRRFLEIRYDWVYQDKPQEGLLLLGADGATASWIDSWHQSKDVMFLKGAPLDVRGTFSVGEGPDWGWRVQLELRGEELRLTMYNISPDGEAFLAVLADYRRH